MLATRATWADIVGLAMHDPEASHVLLAPLMMAWILIARVKGLNAAEPGRRWVGPFLVMLGWGLSWLGFYHAIQLFWHLGAVLVVIGCIASAFGNTWLWRLWPVLIAAVFLVPVPGALRREIAMPLQLFTAEATRWIYALVGVEVTRAGHVLNINGTGVAIAEACNGMRLLTPLLMASYAVAFTRPLRAGARAMILIASPFLAVGCNVLRLIPTVWIYGHGDASAAAQFHDASGWVAAPVALLLMLGVLRLLPRSMAQPRRVIAEPRVA